MNDSKRPLGSRVDRHEHIGKGCLGLEPFRRIVNDRRFATLPMLLETPKGEGKATGRSTSIRSTNGTSRRCGPDAQRDVTYRLGPHLRSPKTSASNRQTWRRAATRRSAGRPCGRCARGSSSASHPHSVATCGSSSPRCQPRSTTSAVAADDDVLRAGDRLERSEQRDLDVESVSSSGATGGKRGSVLAAATAQRGTTPPSGSVALDVADAAAQLAALVKRDERAARPRREIATSPWHVRRGGADVRRDRLAGNLSSSARSCSLVIDEPLRAPRDSSSHLVVYAEMFPARRPDSRRPPICRRRHRPSRRS